MARAERGPPLSGTWAALGVLLPAVVVSGLPMVAIDLAYHLRAGELMLEGGRILRTDPFSLPTLGRPWLDQQWGAQVLFGWVFRLSGWFGLAALRAAGALGAALLLLLACRARGASRRTSAGLTLAAAVAGLGGLQLRPQLLGVLAFTAFLWVAAGRRTSPGRLWLLLPVEVIWANTHGSFPLGPLVLGLFLLEDLAEHDPAARRTAAAVVGTALATLVGPFGVRAWSYAIDLVRDPLVREVVREWRPPDLRSLEGGLFAASVIAVLLVVAYRRPGVRWPQIARLAVFAAAAALSVRAVIWWYPLAAVEIAAMLPATGPGAAERADPRDRRHLAIVGVAVLGLGIVLVPWWGSGDGARPPVSLVSAAPEGLASVAGRLLAPGEPVFAAQAWGSWLEFALPGHPVVVDSRVETISRTTWDDYVAVSTAEPGWPAILESWGIRVLVVDRREQPALLAALQAEPTSWQRLRGDGEGAVFVRLER